MPMPFFLVGEEASEQPIDVIRRDAGSGVLNFNFDAFRLGLDPYDELSFRSARHRLYGVNGEVNKDLLKLNPINQHLWQLGH